MLQEDAQLEPDAARDQTRHAIPSRAMADTHRIADSLSTQCAQGKQTANEMDAATEGWHETSAIEIEPGPVMQLHRANYDLWHLEDQARDPRSTDTVIAGLKKDIDRVNQRRNDLVEAIDNALLGELALANLPDERAELHSETPGQILDRLSILSLKCFHTLLESTRQNASTEHRDHNRHRLQVLRQQQADLAGCLEALWIGVQRRQRSFRLYRQFKMYNDPATNPVLYAQTNTRPPS